MTCEVSKSSGVSGNQPLEVELLQCKSSDEDEDHAEKKENDNVPDKPVLLISKLCQIVSKCKTGLKALGWVGQVTIWSGARNCVGLVGIFEYPVLLHIYFLPGRLRRL